MVHANVLIFLACTFGLLMTYGVGANDLANVLSTSIGSRSITIKHAIIIALIFEFAGAFFAGGQVTATLRGGIINTDLLSSSPETLVNGMLAVLLAGSTWMLIASYFGLPVSITHTIVGAIVGYGIVVLGVHALYWKKIITIGLSWITSPLISGSFGYMLFTSVQRLILATADPFINARRYVPYYMFLIGVIFSLATVLRGLEHWGITLSWGADLLITLATGFILMGLGVIFIRRIRYDKKARRRIQFYQTEKVFSILMFLTACAMVFAHGSNDVANAVGPMAVIVTVAHSGGITTQTGELPFWILVFGCTGIIIGFLVHGRRVIETVGTQITALTPSRAFSGTLAAAATVVFATSAGIPVSTTQILVGAILGVGLARGIGALNLTVIRNIFMSWIITIPAGATFSIIYYYVLTTLLS